MEKTKRIFPEISKEEESCLTEGLSVIWMEENIPYFNEKDMSILVQRLFEQGFEVYGIECFSMKDFGYFKAYVQELFMDDFNIGIKEWHIKAFNKIVEDYAKLVAVEEPDNPPVYNISFGKQK